MADRYSDDTLDNALVIIDLISLSDEALHELYRRVRVELQRREVPWEILEDTADISEAPAAAAAPPAGGEVPAQKPAEENTQEVHVDEHVVPIRDVCFLALCFPPSILPLKLFPAGERPAGAARTAARSPRQQPGGSTAARNPRGGKSTPARGGGFRAVLQADWSEA